MSNVNLLQSKKDIDKYYLEIARGAGRPNLQNRGTGDSQASFTDERSGGGDKINASKNIQYNSVYPVFNTLQLVKYIIIALLIIVSVIIAVSFDSNINSFCDVLFLDQIVYDTVS